jgi:hypothetical protein
MVCGTSTAVYLFSILTMKQLLIRITVFLIPILIVVGVYGLLDPFKVVRTYSNYKPEGFPLSVPLNQNRVSAGTFSFYHDSLHYDSFIFGSSRSMFYEVNDWKPYLNKDAVCFHFDASAETLDGVLHKIEFLEREKVKPRNVLFIFDADLFRPYTLLNEHLYMEDPIVVGAGRWLPFQSAHFRAFLDRKFMRAFLDYTISGSVKPYMTELNLLDDKPFSYDPLTNEMRYTYFEQLAAKGQYYNEKRMAKFSMKRDTVQHISKPVIDQKAEMKLNRIAAILKKSETDVRVIISPLYNQIKFAQEDLDILKHHFGKNSVYDFSGINALTKSHLGYYEQSHYRPILAKAVLDSVYGGLSTQQGY